MNTLPPDAHPLCVDLDETLILTDTFYTGLTHLVREQPLKIPRLLLQFIHGRAAAKTWLTQHLSFSPAALPYRAALVDYLRREKAKGRKLYLVSASAEAWVKAVAGHLGFFDGAYGSTARLNLKGHNKSTFILQHIAPAFVYAGDSFADCAVWARAQGAILCGPKTAFLRRKISIPVEAEFA